MSLVTVSTDYVFLDLKGSGYSLPVTVHVQEGKIVFQIKLSDERWVTLSPEIVCGGTREQKDGFQVVVTTEKFNGDGKYSHMVEHMMELPELEA
jgi:hypothetical protein